MTALVYEPFNADAKAFLTATMHHLDAPEGKQDVHALCLTELTCLQFDALQKAQFDSDDARMRLDGFRGCLARIPKKRLDLLRHMFEFLRNVVREHKHNR